MLEVNSITLFRDLISEFNEDYRAVNEVQILFDARQFLGLIESNRESTAETSIDFQSIDKDKLRDTYLSDLALLYLEEPSGNDPLIDELLAEPMETFQPYLVEAELFRTAFVRIQRKDNKQLLQEIEAGLEAEELFHAFNRMQRRENKELLQSMEEATETVNFNAASFGTASRNTDPDKHSSRGKSLQMAFRIAALLVIIAIPVGILRMYYIGVANQNSSDTAQKKQKKPNPSSDYFATAYVDIELPEETQNIRATKVEATSGSQGFGNTDELFEITLIGLKGQIDYLISRKQKIQSRVSELSTKDFKSKTSTLDSLNKALEKNQMLNKQIKSKELTYTLVGKKLKIYLVKQKDLQQLKVFNYDNINTPNYYLYMEGKYYPLTNKKGELKAETDEVIISALESKQ